MEFSVIINADDNPEVILAGVPPETHTLAIVNKSKQPVHLVSQLLHAVSMTGPGLVLLDVPALTTLCLIDAGPILASAMDVELVRTPMPTGCTPARLVVVDPPLAFAECPVSVIYLSLVACKNPVPISPDHRFEYVSMCDMNYIPVTTGVLELTRVVVTGGLLKTPSVTLTEMDNVIIAGPVDVLKLLKSTNITLSAPVDTVITDGDIAKFLNVRRVCLTRPPAEHEELFLRDSRKGTIPPAFPNLVI